MDSGRYSPNRQPCIQGSKNTFQTVFVTGDFYCLTVAVTGNRC